LFHPSGSKELHRLPRANGKADFCSL